MALHTELNVYKTGYDLLQKVVAVVENMERRFKNLIGEDIARECSRLLILVYRANVASDKVPHLDTLVERLRLIELLMQLSLDMKKISPRQYWAIVKLTESISKQVTKWRAWSVTRPSHAGRGRHD